MPPDNYANVDHDGNRRDNPPGRGIRLVLQILEYQPVELNVATPSDVPNEEDEGLESGSPGLGPHNPDDQRGNTTSSSHFSGGKMLAPNLLAASEYWEPEEISELTLAALLNTTDGITLYWEMNQFSREIFRPIRRDDSSLWGDSLPIKGIPLLALYSARHHHFTPPPSPPMTPFVLALNSAVGDGAVGWVYQGRLLGLSIPLIVKILPTDCMDHELKIWRRLRDLAGICVPGLFGAYSLEGQEGREDTGALVQQYAGATLSSFDTLDHKQRRVITTILAARMGLYELIPLPSDASFIALLLKSMSHMSSMET
ncbi:hypothetical protein M407DRAFT_21327 [Tulasnella calospora MUT 4182]|uniref:Protein kinase domain-containing protein n=1 Tax=Tulasnella calospora MUT 4182 TaxID=1051891 RepID=A0A0C3QNF9_9AGAM|nr:hypothetical protein M407DRAFT_21327 [Tulasnella calospora MUT 4182]